MIEFIRILSEDPAGVAYLGAVAAIITAVAALRQAGKDSYRLQDHEARIRVLESKQ